MGRCGERRPIDRLVLGLLPLHEQPAALQRWRGQVPAGLCDRLLPRYLGQWGDSTEQYVVGWSEPTGGYNYQLARVDAAGTFLEGPVNVTSQVQWGRRDDPFRAHYNGDVVWAWFDAPGSTTLRFARLVSGSTYSCVSF